ncbi:MAG: DUF4157 domain-containing protein [Deltaproteobacteria bacterium]|nr:DUF4157 domain-containing protein [Deltaproteobacteria bacterium]
MGGDRTRTRSERDAAHARRPTRTSEEPTIRAFAASNRAALHILDLIEDEHDRLAASADHLDAPPLVHEVVRSAGQPLDPVTREVMESRFGHDLGHVLVHTSAHAAASARSVYARAYTVGNHMVFGEGRYAPGTAEGDNVLAHELVHTLQQRNVQLPMGPLRVTGPNDAHEAEAHRIADRTSTAHADGRAPVSVTTTGPQLARQRDEQPTLFKDLRAIAESTRELQADDDLLLVDDGARAFFSSLHAGNVFGEYEGCRRKQARAVIHYYWDGSCAIVGYVLHFENPEGSNFPQPVMILDTAGGVRGVTATDRQSLDSVVSPIDFLGPGLLTRPAILASRAVYDASKAVVKQVGTAVAGPTRSVVFSARLATSKSIAAAMEGSADVLGELAVSAGGTVPRAASTAGRAVAPAPAPAEAASAARHVAPARPSELGVHVTRAPTPAATVPETSHAAAPSLTTSAAALGAAATKDVTPPTTPALDPGGRGKYTLAEATVGKLPAGEAAELRRLQTKMPESELELERLVALRGRAHGAELPVNDPGTPEHMLQRWREYLATDRPTKQTFLRWVAGHPSRMASSVRGVEIERIYRALAGDDAHAAGKVLRSPEGRLRQVDVPFVAGRGVRRTLLQVKSGAESLTTGSRTSGGKSRGATSLSNSDALDIDSTFVQISMDRVVWAFEGYASGPLIRKAVESGIIVIHRIADAAERLRLMNRLRRANVPQHTIDALIRDGKLILFEGDVDTFRRSVIDWVKK